MSGHDCFVGLAPHVVHANASDQRRLHLAWERAGAKEWARLVSSEPGYQRHMQTVDKFKGNRIIEANKLALRHAGGRFCMGGMLCRQQAGRWKAQMMP